MAEWQNGKIVGWQDRSGGIVSSVSRDGRMSESISVT